MAKCNFENPRANENPNIKDDIDLNDLLRTFDDDPNNEVKAFICSPYIDIEGLTPLLSRYKNGFAVLSLNIQSINSKFDALTAVLSELNNNGIKFDAICLQETWLSIDQDTALFNIPGYQLISQGKSCSSHYGLIILLSNEYSYLIRSSHNNSKLWDGIFIEVSGKSLREKVLIGNMYRSLHSNNNNRTISEFCQEIAPIISDVTKGNASIIITGDFNIDLLEINERSEFQKYFDILVTHGMFPKITVPTRSSKFNASLIDQMFCKLKDLTQHLLSCVVKSSLSDHFPYISVFDILKTVRHRPKFVQINRSDEDSFKAFHDEVHSRLLNFNMNPDLFCDPNENYKQFE